MVKILGWGCLFAIIGFGVGRLRFFTLQRRIFKKRKHKVVAINTQKSDEALLQVWQTVYQQSADTLRAQAKLLISINFAALAGAIALMKIGKAQHDDLLVWSIWCLAIGLIGSFLPITGLSDHFRDSLSSVMRQLVNNKKGQPILVRHAAPTGIRSHVAVLSLILSGIGIALLSVSLVGIPQQGRERPVCFSILKQHSQIITPAYTERGRKSPACSETPFAQGTACPHVLSQVAYTFARPSCRTLRHHT